MEKKIRLRTVNPQITCILCKGYLIDATTITECLHTFCKSCIVKFLEEHNTCPKCKIVIHQSYPMNYISFDRTMQDIVYKLVPKLQEKETRRQIEFYKKRGLPFPNLIVNDENSNERSKTPIIANGDDQDYHRSDEQINVCLECMADNMRPLMYPFLRLSSQATILHLKKFIALKLYRDTTRFKEVDILCNEEMLGKDHTLKFVFMTRWRTKDVPLKLHYRQRVAEL